MQYTRDMIYTPDPYLYFQASHCKCRLALRVTKPNMGELKPYYIEALSKLAQVNKGAIRSIPRYQTLWY